MNWLKPYISEQAIIVEAGTCDGTDTLRLSLGWPKAIIVGFEPVPELYRKAVERLQGVDNVRLLPYALSDQTGEAEMFVSTRHGEVFGSSSLHRPKEHLSFHPEIEFPRRLTVMTTTLDDFLGKEGILPDTLFFDMQGAELKVMRASPKTLANVKTIYTEVSLMEMYEGVPLYGEVKNFLTGQGFSLVKEDLPWKDMGNVLFTR